MENNLVKLKEFIDSSVKNADRNISNLRNENITKHLKGFNSVRVRHLLNNLCNREGTCYVEFGTYRGASIISALYNNIGIGYTIDNFKYNPYQNPSYNEEGFNEIENDLKSNLKRFNLLDRVTIIRDNIEKFKIKNIEHQVSVFYYDAIPTKGKIYNHISKIAPNFAQYTIVITNHTRTEGVVGAFERVFSELKFNVAHEVTLNSYHAQDANSWWSGIKIWLIEKDKPLNTKESIEAANIKTAKLTSNYHENQKANKE